MIIIYGSGKNVIRVAEGDQYCARCGQDQPHSLILQYYYHHLFYLGYVWEERYLLLCDICQTGGDLLAKSILSKLKHDPMPFQDRYGCMIFFALVLLAIGFCLLMKFS